MRDMVHSGQLAGHTAVVVGAGASGRAAVRLLSRLGAWVRLLEKNPAAIPADFCQAQACKGVEILTGEHTPGHFAGADLVVLSPGISRASLAPYLTACPDAQVLAELELASWFVEAPMVAVTGTNGKTTTVMLISHLLTRAGLSVFTGGNIGTPLSEYVLAGEPADVCVIEASSFQLQNVFTFHPKVAVLLNFSANHLDWHADMDEYLAAKLRLFAMQGPPDLAIVPADLDYLLTGRAFTKARIETFAASDRFRCPRLLGRHNQADMEAAFAAVRPFGVTQELAETAFFDFAPAPHRIQVLGEKRGVIFVDDSKATTVTAMRAAIETFDRPVHLLAGGVFKGGDLEGMITLLRERVKSVGLFGGSREIFESAWQGALPLEWSATLAEAVEKLYARALSGEVILLSPATSSFDLYSSYKARGRDFQAVFAALPGAPESPTGEKP
ncbi:UDP-N-acetylmuramoyl-L-alanine--D-glutamate ligase [Desulfovibrio sulfodismutans]|uniref:UDP-N-acetylmuramoylalanine--D-glutamate ligase n=1 Tax=Desulfolutivibrio sulfodismutans TaxID=63561 RepID=A0A7K3NIR7_9BACT|nr:UDP-N-acetylmuramoyl-L-alanine--D-glutamate ligase [Desulfolutivibrio sulfodismutans]NDY56050.1 UDP-N-acetylmuramoyl-L-alanine--D-glutamate ligase [Desulfolutivibrio sulfodismutans]QLA12307.1 UDP-N-acetylmuramoyl-L-alanine--D-glutamate ligase [Desulfolutivibrio sulfodismutans DSM 3696]